MFELESLVMFYVEGALYCNLCHAKLGKRSLAAMYILVNLHLPSLIENFYVVESFGSS